MTSHIDPLSTLNDYALPAHVTAAIRQAVREAIDDYLPTVAGVPPRHVDAHGVITADDVGPVSPGRTATVRGVVVHVDGECPITFTRRKGLCPACNTRLGLNEKIQGFQRVDDPDQAVWVCHRCAKRLRS